MPTANRPYLIWDADRGVYIIPFRSTPAEGAPPQTLAWHSKSRTLLSMRGWVLVGFAACWIVAAIFLMGALS